MRIFRLIMPLLLASTYCLGQLSYSVIGNITVGKTYAPSGNILALQVSDSALIQGDFFVDGSFELHGILDKDVLIQFTSLEFEDTFMQISFTQDSVLDLGTLVFDKAGIEMDEVVVRGRKPIYVQKENGTVAVQVRNTTLASSNTVNEILSKSPDVIVDEEGGVTVFGKGDALIYLNGKRINQNQLALITPSSIQEIEIIRNPSAKYDAEGGAVIHILTSRPTASGYQAQLQQNLSYSDFAGVDRRSSADLTINSGKISAQANYGLLQGKDRHILHTTRDRDAEEVYLKTNLTTEWRNKYENYSNYGFGLQYDYNDKSYVSMAYSGFSNQLGGNQLSQNTIEDAVSTNFYKSDILRNERNINNSLSLNFQQAIDTSGSHVFVGGQYSNYAFMADNPIFENRFESVGSSSRELRNNTALDVFIVSVQADVQKVFKNRNTLTFGIKYSTVDNNSDLDFQIKNDNGYTIDPRLSNNFSYEEDVSAVYWQYNGKFNNRVSYSIGLRSEYTQYNLQLSQLSGQQIKDHYLNLFPQFSINKQFSDPYNVNFSYTSRISRVPYQRLNPVLYYQDPFTSIQGNPESVPEKSHNFEINSKLNRTNVRVGYNYTIDPFGGGAIRGENPKSYILIRLNFDEAHEYYTSLQRNFETDWISSSNTFSMRYTDIIDRVHNFDKVGSKPNMYFNSVNRIPIRNGFHFELSFNYLGDNYEGVYARKSSWNLNLALDKRFFSDALKCRLIVNDIFHSTRAAGDYSIGETDIYFHRHWNTHYVRLSVSYNFGDLGASSYKNKGIGKEENDRAR